MITPGLLGAQTVSPDCDSESRKSYGRNRVMFTEEKWLRMTESSDA